MCVCVCVCVCLILLLGCVYLLGSVCGSLTDSYCVGVCVCGMYVRVNS